MRLRLGKARLFTVGCLLVAASLTGRSSAVTDEIRVMTGGSTAAGWLKLAPTFERSTKYKTVTLATEMGVGQDTIPNRISRGEPVDVVLLPGSLVDDLVKDGSLLAGSRVDLAKSRIGIAVRTGTPRPTVRTVDDIKRALLQAKSVALSVQTSGRYVSTELLPKLGIADQVLPKVRTVEGELVGDVLVRGEAEIGLQQISELRAVAGVDYLGPLPSELQRVTIVSAAIPKSARNPEAARTLIRFLASPAAAAVFEATGLELLTTP